MTGLLMSVMHEHAGTLAGPDLDIDAIVAEGDRRVRRQRLSTGLVAAAVSGTVAAAALSVPLLLGADPGELGPATETGAFEQRRMTYAVDGVITYGTETYTVGHPVASLVPTDDGFVYTDPLGTVYLFDGAGSVPIGTAEGNRLRADDQGSLVAWVETTSAGRPQYVVYDTATQSTLARVDGAAGAGTDRQVAEVYAVDDGSVYWRRGADLVRYDVPSDRQSVLAATPGTRILDVAYGTLAYSVDRGQGSGAAVGQTLDPDGSIVSRADHVLLSPDARFVAAQDADDIAIYDVRSGEDVTPATDGYPSATVVGWVDDDTATVVAVSALNGDGGASGDVLRCDIREACTVTDRFEDRQGDELVPPVGDPTS